MRIYYKYFFLVFPLLSATTIDHNNICGTYVINNSEWGGQTLVIKNNRHFIETITSCVSGNQTTGKWETNQDTIILETTLRKDLRTKQEFKIDNTIEKYLIKVDTLFRINNENGSVTLDSEFALIRKRKK